MSIELARSAFKSYQDHPYLWAVHPTLDAGLRVKPNKDPGTLSLVGSDKTRFRWWVRYGCPADLKECMIQVAHADENNLAADILASLGEWSNRGIIRAIVSFDEKKRIIFIHKPIEHGCLLDTCRNRQRTRRQNA